MIRSIEATGKTIDLAVDAALGELGLTRDDITYEVITTPKSGFLGIGAVPARVRVSYDDGKAEPKQPKAPKPAKKPAAPVKEEKKTSTPKTTAPAAAGSREERAESFLRGLLEHMGVECTIDVKPREGGGLDITLDGSNMGAVIGRRGETLDAIQHLVNYAVNRGSEKHMHISVDAEGYRSKREDSLVHLAQKMAAKAIKYKRSMALEPMNSYERHVIHTALQDYEGVSTSSIGTEPNRRVVVNYERPAGESDNTRGRHGARGERNRAPRAEKPAEKPQEVTETPAEAPVKETLPPDYPEGYTPPTKNKPTSREWC